MRISGAIATIGVTCRMTAKGKSASSTQRDCAISIASADAADERERERREGDLAA